MGNQKSGIVTAVLMLILILVLLVAIFLELGGFRLFLKQPESVAALPPAQVLEVASTTPEIQPEIVPPSIILSETSPSSTKKYIQITDSCDFSYQGECVRVRSGAGLTTPVVGTLRSGMVLAYEDIVEADGLRWYKIVFDEWLRYPERVADDWYIAADFVEEVFDPQFTEASSTKKIVVDRSEQMLRAFDGEVIFMETAISTGLELTPTPRGTFSVFKKLPTRYMQGPLPYLANSRYFDMPGVPWNLYFTQQGAVIHGAYWHNSFGAPYSHGCVNLPPALAKTLYDWASIGTTVVVKD
jgi:L,D-transpeptidase catalytic domain